MRYEKNYLIVSNDQLSLGDKKDNFFWSWNNDVLTLTFRDFDNDKYYYLLEPKKDEIAQITSDGKNSTTNIKLTKDGQITSVDQQLCLSINDTKIIWKQCIDNKPPIGAIFNIELPSSNKCGDENCPSPFKCENSICNYCSPSKIPCGPGFVPKCIYDKNNKSYKTECVLINRCKNTDIKCSPSQIVVCADDGRFVCKEKSDPTAACPNITDEKKTEYVNQCNEMTNDKTKFTLTCNPSTNFQWHCYPECNIVDNKQCPDTQKPTCSINPVSGFPEFVCENEGYNPCGEITDSLNCPPWEDTCLEQENTGIWYKKCKYQYDLTDWLNKNKNFDILSCINILDKDNKIPVVYDKLNRSVVVPTKLLNSGQESDNFDDFILNLINNPDGHVDIDFEVIYLSSDFSFTDNNTIDFSKIPFENKSLVCFDFDENHKQIYQNLTIYTITKNDKTSVYINFGDNPTLTTNMNNPPFQLKLMKENCYNYFQNYKGENITFDSSGNVNSSDKPTKFYLCEGDCSSSPPPPCVPTSFCVVQDNTYKCIIPTDKDLDYYNQNYVRCFNDDVCSQLLTEAEEKYGNYNLPPDCITGEAGRWDMGQPKQGVTQMKYGNCGGGWDVGGNCDLKQYTTDEVNSKDFPCPPGTKPYFWASKYDISSGKDCDNNHKAFYSRIDYTCCDDKTFPYDENNTQPSGNPNQSVCLPNQYSLKGDSELVPTSIIIGRDGKMNNHNKDNPIASENGCNIHAGPTLLKLRRLLADANWEIWNSKPLDCSKAEGD